MRGPALARGDHGRHVARSGYRFALRRFFSDHAMLRSPARGAMVAPSRGHAISAWSLRDHFTRSAEFARKVFQLRQAIAQRQHGFRVVDVHARFDIKLWNRDGEDVDQAERRESP